jgi:hypothetical protein
MNDWCNLLVFHAYIKEMRGSRSKIPIKNLVSQRCAEGSDSGVKGLTVFANIEIMIHKDVCRFKSLKTYFFTSCYMI